MYNYIFFSRSSIDLDYFLPYLSFEKTKGIVVNYTNYKLPNHLRDILLHFNINYTNVTNNVFSNKFFKLFFSNKLEVFFLKNKLNKILAKCNSKTLIIFDHVDPNVCKEILDHIQNKLPRIKSISVPHGVSLFKNTIQDFHQISPGSSYSNHYVDNIFYPEENLNNLNNFNKIKSLKYNSYWKNSCKSVIKLNLKTKFIHNDDKINILFIHTKFQGNVSSIEVIRCFKILNSLKKFNIYIKPHPRSTNNEIRSLILDSSMNFISRNLTSFDFRHFDFAICHQSSTLLDLEETNLIVPTFFDSSILNYDLFNSIKLISPDDFYHYFKKVSIDGFTSKLSDSKIDLKFNKELFYKSLNDFWKNF